jgi:hypothetical protein
MERELNDLRARLAIQDQIAPSLGIHHDLGGTLTKDNSIEDKASQDQYMGNHEAVASLMDLRQGHDSGSYPRGTNGSSITYRILGNVRLSPPRVSELFSQ